MKRDNLLVIGNGKAGNVLTDILKDINNRYSTLYINSSLNDLKNLKYTDIDSNVFIFANTDGTGSNRNKAKKVILNDRVRFASFIKKYAQFKYILIITSLGGGTGSGSSIDVIKIIKKIFPNTIVNLVGVLPSYKSSNLELKNTLDFFYDLNEISHLINDIKFIDNNKRESYEDINKESMLAIDSSYSMLGTSKYGDIDENNLCNVTCSKGYGVSLLLNSKYDTLKESVKHSISNSVFAIPDDLSCSYGAINISNKYNIDEINGIIKSDETFYKTLCSKNILALGGCSFPDGIIEEYEDILKEIELRKDNSKGKEFNYESRYNFNGKKEILDSEEKEINKFVNDDDIDELFDLDNFRLK